MYAKIAVIGDPHNKDDNYLETIELGKRLVEILTLQKPDLIVVAGDILHTMDVAHVKPHKISIILLRELKKIANVCLLIGNHDLPSPISFLSDDHFFTSLYEWPNLMVVDTQCQTFEINGIKFAAVPYVCEGRFQEALNSNPNYNESEVAAIFGHQQFLGCKMDKIISRTGDRWSSEKPLVISGHIHEYQRLANNLIYVGTPRQSSFRDSTDKTISIFEFQNTEEKNYIRSNKTYWKETRISVGLPIKIIYTISASELPTWVSPSGHKVKLVITGTHAEIASIKEHFNIKRLKDQGVVITYADILGKLSSNKSFIQPPSNFQSFTSLYKQKINENDRHVKLYQEVIEGIEINRLI